MYHNNEETKAKIGKVSVFVSRYDSVNLDEHGEAKLRKGVAKNRRIAIEDEEMRHGRKNRTKKFDGYKRHILKDLDLGMVRAVGITIKTTQGYLLPNQALLSFRLLNRCSRD